MLDRTLHQRVTAIWTVCRELRRFEAEGHHDASWACIAALREMQQDINPRIARLAVTTVEHITARLLESEDQCCSQSSIP